MHRLIALLCLFLCGTVSVAEAAYVLKGGRLVNAEDVAVYPVEKHYELGITAYNDCDWEEAAKNFRAIIYSFPNSSYALDSYFFLGVSDYYMDDLDFANESLTQYLKLQNNPKYFEQTIEYKFAIAERFRCGARKHFLGTNKLPKWASGRSLGLKIYDEVIAALPAHDLAARALYSKGLLLWEDDCYRESIDSFQTLIRRFPKHELAPEAYIAIADVYVEQSISEFQNPDLLALAGINYRKFAQDFPRDERLKVVEERVQWMKESYAQGLYEIGRFYERKDKPCASAIYYKKAIKDYPDTTVAECARTRLFKLGCPVDDFPEPSAAPSETVGTDIDLAS
jgi:outer membrane protein assembly factor BamD (BamD/ComL family)